MNADDVSAQVDDMGRRADDSTALDHAVRFGLLAYGVMHLLVAWVAVQLAFGDSSGPDTSRGALSALASTPVGGVLLYAVAVGFAALVVWQLLDAVAGHRDEQGGSRWLGRARSLTMAVIYGALGGTALRIAIAGSGGGGPDPITARLMSMPAGQVLVGLVGLTVFAFGCNLIYQGLSESFMDELHTDGKTGHSGRAFVLLGTVGHVAKGLALFLVAGLFVWAAVTHDAQKSGGLDQALHQVLRQPFGAPLLVALGVGIGCFGLFTFAWARHLDR